MVGLKILVTYVGETETTFLLYSVINSVANCIHLQEDRNLLHQWSIMWLVFNPVKCELILFITPLHWQFYH